MIRIAHRGNFAGRDPDKENTLDYLDAAVNAGHDIMVDAWFLNRQWYLGYDMPHTHVTPAFFENPYVWTKARNLEAYVALFSNPKAHVFWLNHDNFTFTSKNIKWANTGVWTLDGVVYMPEDSPEILAELSKPEIVTPLAVCSNTFEYLK